MDEGDSIQAEVKGAFGRARGAVREHTGFEISAAGLTWEVDVSSHTTLLEAAERFAGTQAVVRGMYTERRAPRVRRILAAQAIDAATERGPAEFIDVTIRGTLTTGMIAIGGETTGATITTGAVTWELQLDDKQRELAERLSGRKATVSGQLRHAAGVEIRTRVIVTVRRIE